MAVITVASGNLDWYAGAESLSLRIFCNKTFANASNETVVAGSSYQDFYLEVNVTAAPCDNDTGFHLVFDEFSLDSTADGTPADSSYRLELWADGTHKIKTVYKRLRVPASPTSTTLAALVAFSEGPQAAPDDTFLTVDAFNTAIAALSDTALPSSTSQRGTAKSSYASEDGANPIHMERNDPVIRGVHAPFYIQEFSNLSDAATSIVALVGSDPAELIIGCPITHSGTLSFPDNIYVSYQADGKITCSSGTLTINAPSDDCGGRQIWAGAGSILARARNVLYLSWWTGGDTGTDDTHAMQQLVDSCGTLDTFGGVIMIHSGLIKFKDISSSLRGLHFRGTGFSADQFQQGQPIGTTFQLLDNTAEALFVIDQGSGDFVSFENLGLSAGVHPTPSLLHITGVQGNGDNYFTYFRRCGFQGAWNVDATGQKLLNFDSTGIGAWETLCNVFDNCWFQTPQNGHSFYVDSVNTSFSFRDCMFQGAVGARHMLGDLGGGWIHVENCQFTGPGKTPGAYIDNRTGLAGTLTPMTYYTGGSADYAEIEVTTGTLTQNDKGRAVIFDLGFEAYFHKIIDSTHAVLSTKPGSYTGYTNAAFSIKDWGDSTTSAESCMEFGNVRRLTVVNSVDEGANYFLKYGSADFTSMVVLQGVTTQSQIEFTDASVMVAYGCSFPSLVFKDSTAPGADIKVFTRDCTVTPATVHNQIYLADAEFWDYQRLDGPMHHDSQNDILIRTLYFTGAVPTYSYPVTNATKQRLNLIDVNGQTYDALEDPLATPYLALGHTAVLAGTYQTLLRMGRYSAFDKRTPLYYFDWWRNDDDGALELYGNQDGYRRFRFLDMPVEADAFLVRDVTTTGAGSLAGFGYVADAVNHGVSQTVSRTNDVTANYLGGTITLRSDSLADGASAEFQIFNNKFNEYDFPNVGLRSGGSGYQLEVIGTSTGIIRCRIKNIAGAPNTTVPVMYFYITRGQV